MKKFKLTKTTKTDHGVKLYQIKACKDFRDVRKGELGGWVEKEANLSQNGDSWIYENAQVYENARVSGNACVYGDAWVYGDAQVYENAQVYGDAQVYGNARVYENAQVYGDAQVYGNARVYGDAQVYEKNLIDGYFFYTKEEGEEIEEIEIGDKTIACVNPKFDNEKPESDATEEAMKLLKNKGYRIVKDNDDDCDEDCC